MSLRAQFARMEAGGYLGYGRLAQKNWTKTIEQFNNEEPAVGEMKKFGGGYTLGAYFRYNFPKSVMLTPSIGISKYSRKFESDSGSLKLSARFINLRLNVDVYLLNMLMLSKFTKGYNPEWRNRFFVRIAPGYSLLAFKANGYTKNPLRDSVGVVGSGGFQFGLGAGYQIYITDRISISPIVMMNFGKAAATGFSEKMLPSTATVGSDGGMARQLTFEAHIGYTIKALKPLCPIPDCRVAQEHKHRDIGGETVFRGNPHNLWQNPRYGQKHRGGDRKKLKYKKKEEKKEEEATVEEETTKEEDKKKGKKLMFDPNKDITPTKDAPKEEPKEEEKTDDDGFGGDDGDGGN
ncbi:MAG: hypothetical protein OHK0038_05080 [Flammeovirgaceae bacterium]